MAFKMKCQFGILTGFLVALVTFVLSYMYLQQDFLDQIESFSVLPPIQFAERRSSVEKSAYVLLALGPQAFQRNCPAAIETLVKHAGWDGDVYLISDKPRCFNKTKIIHNSGIQKEKMHFVFINGDKFYTGGISTAHKNTQIVFQKGRLLAKGMKTRIFDYIDPEIEQIAFADCDMLFGIEGCATDFMNSGPPFGPDVHLKVRKVYRDDSTGALTGIHTGVFVAHREYSKETFRLWGESINSFKYHMDFLAYLAAYQKFVKKLIANKQVHPKAVQNYTLNPLEPTRVQLNYPIELFVNETTLNGKMFACMNHITKQRCTDLGRDTVRTFVDRFRLKNYEGGQHYCVHEWLKPALYGWFPLNWLPTCPKFENIL